MGNRQGRGGRVRKAIGNDVRGVLKGNWQRAIGNDVEGVLKSNRQLATGNDVSGLLKKAMPARIPELLRRRRDVGGVLKGQLAIGNWQDEEGVLISNRQLAIGKT